MNAIFITGPTGVGKTAIALMAAARFDGEIVGADAFQIYQGMDILTAKPSVGERRSVPHHLIDVIPPGQTYDVAQYLETARRCIGDITARGRLPIVTGGTGLYIRALTHGISDLPKADTTLRAELDSQSLDTLQSRYAALDPEGAKTIDMKNRRRLVRALEVCLLTGKPFSTFREEWETTPENIRGVFLTRDREDLYSRINRRVDEMFRQGVVQEVAAVLRAGFTARQAIGFKEIQEHLHGGLGERECITRIQQATRNYAKRQITWFKRETMFEPINLTANPDPEYVLREIGGKIGR